MRGRGISEIEGGAALASNEQLQRTVMHKVPIHIGQRAAAALRRQATTIEPDFLNASRGISGGATFMTILWGKALAVWWSAAWRGALYGALGGFLLGGIAGATAAILGAPEQSGLYGSIAGYVAAIAASMLGLKQALSKHLPSLIASLPPQAPLATPNVAS